MLFLFCIAISLKHFGVNNIVWKKKETIVKIKESATIVATKSEGLENKEEDKQR